MLCVSDPVMVQAAFMQRLLTGDLPAWLSPMTGTDGGLILLRVDRAALEALP